MATDPKRKNLFLQGHGEFGRRRSQLVEGKRMENWGVEDGNLEEFPLTNSLKNPPIFVILMNFPQFFVESSSPIYAISRFDFSG